MLKEQKWGMLMELKMLKGVKGEILKEVKGKMLKRND